MDTLLKGILVASARQLFFLSFHIFQDYEKLNGLKRSTSRSRAIFSVAVVVIGRWMLDLEGKKMTWLQPQLT